MVGSARHKRSRAGGELSADDAGESGRPERRAVSYSVSEPVASASDPYRDRKRLDLQRKSEPERRPGQRWHDWSGVDRNGRRDRATTTAAIATSATVATTESAEAAA
jgi:hypothetical protein